MSAANVSTATRAHASFMASTKATFSTSEIRSACFSGSSGADARASGGIPRVWLYPIAGCEAADDVLRIIGCARINNSVDQRDSNGAAEIAHKVEETAGIINGGLRQMAKGKLCRGKNAKHDGAPRTSCGQNISSKSVALV